MHYVCMYVCMYVRSHVLFGCVSLWHLSITHIHPHILFWASNSSVSSPIAALSSRVVPPSLGQEMTVMVTSCFCGCHDSQFLCCYCLTASPLKLAPPRIYPLFSHSSVFPRMSFLECCFCQQPHLFSRGDVTTHITQC